MLTNPITFCQKVLVTNNLFPFSSFSVVSSIYNVEIIERFAKKKYWLKQIQWNSFNTNTKLTCQSVPIIEVSVLTGSSDINSRTRVLSIKRLRQKFYGNKMFTLVCSLYKFKLPKVALLKQPNSTYASQVAYLKSYAQQNKHTTLQLAAVKTSVKCNYTFLNLLTSNVI